MTSAETGYQTYELQPAVVRAAIEDLASRKILFFFVAYLQLRLIAHRLGTTDGLKPSPWKDVADLLRMPGGPPNKPYYRPFGIESHNGLDTLWFNRNLAGSWAPRSIRDPNQAARQVVGLEGPTRDQTYWLKPNHARLALEHLLHGEPIPSFSLGAFMLRDYGLAQPSGPLHPTSVSDAFLWRFGFYDDHGLDADASILFDASIPSLPDPWCSEIPESAAGEFE